MELAELTAYAKEKYQMEEMHKWPGFPGFSVLCHPRTGQWVALLMRQWDSDTGTFIERCDLKCGPQATVPFHEPYLTMPVRMHGSKWIGVSFGDDTDADVVKALFDRTMALADRDAPTWKKDPASGGSSAGGGFSASGGLSAGGSTHVSGGYKDTLLPKPSREYAREDSTIPPRIREMLRLYEYGRESMEARTRNFCRQAAFMKDYEDDYPWTGSFDHYYPTYHDMTARQLRGYFSWRTRLRRGEYGQLPASAACIYIFELLNGIGVTSPEDCLDKMKEFEKAFLNAGLGGQGLFASRFKRYLRQWMLDYCVVNRIPAETALDFLPPHEVEKNAALTTLKSPDMAEDEAVFRALLDMTGYGIGKSTAYKKDSGRTVHIIAAAWRKASIEYSFQGTDLYTLCFGRRITRHWYPFSNAVYSWEDNSYPENAFSYEINGGIYSYKNGGWKVSSYEDIYFDIKRLKSFLHESDSLIRVYLKAGRYLTEKPENKWAAPYIQAAIGDDRRESEEAARPRITIDMSELDKIRSDAAATRDSLLTEEDVRELEEYPGIQEHGTGTAAPGIQKPAKLQDSAGSVSDTEDSSQMKPVSDTEDACRTKPASDTEDAYRTKPASDTEATCRTDTAEPAGRTGLPSVYETILRILVDGGSPDAVIKEKHLMASIVADTINEGLFDEIGDVVVTCEDDRLALVEDYKEDLAGILP
jgi:hypothetical protein